VVDITAHMDRKLDAVFAFHSQFEGKTWAGEIFPGGDRPLREQILAHAAWAGSLIRVAYGEPYAAPDVLEVEDVVALRGRSV
jgi:hypothetical protein